jgi:hypothetical protein
VEKYGYFSQSVLCISHDPHDKQPINRLVLIMETHRVFCDIATAILKVIYVNFMLKILMRCYGGSDCGNLWLPSCKFGQA